MRSFIRHPIDIPIEYQLDDEPVQAGPDHMKDVGGGGLSFFTPRPLSPGTALTLRIASVDPDFSARARVMWCRERDGGYVVGVAFADAGELFQMRMVEQLCHIERYRIDVLANEGRQLDAEQAAREWISTFAGGFPDMKQ